MSEFIQKIISILLLNNSSNDISNKDIQNYSNNNNECDNKCKGNNNNSDSSKNKKDEKRNTIITNTFNYSPEITFSRMPILYRNNCFNNIWNGLKLSLSFRPTHFFNLDYMINIEKNKPLFNNYSLNCSSVVPFSSILFPIYLILIGNKESSRAFSLQSHILLGDKDKISISTNNIPNDMNNIDINNYVFLMKKNKKNILYEEKEINLDGNNNINDNKIDEKEIKKEPDNKYSIEYSHEFKRGNIGIKFTNLEPNTVNFQVSIYKNLFFGMEFFKNPNKEEKYHLLKANYGIMLKQTPFNNFGFTFNYISTLPASIINICYKINDNFKLYLNTTFNRNELILKSGKPKFNAAISSFYKNDYIELNTEFNKKGEIKFLSSFSCNKYIDILMNFNYQHFAKKNQKKFKHFGFGLHIKNNAVEEKIEELIEPQKQGYFQSSKYYNNNCKNCII